MKLHTCKKEYCGKLAKGCVQCIAGRKSVLFITGFCHYKCFYCPISDDKRKVDICKINEQIIHNPDSQEGLDVLFNEIRLCQSKGVGITGGDPLARLERTCNYIKALKNEFGDDFHTHLYTPPELVNVDSLKALESAGLDEIRFHPNIEDKKFWKNIDCAKDFKFVKGIEIPMLPDKIEETKELLDHFNNLGFIEFVNINELEYSDISEDVLSKRGYTVKNRLSYGIWESEESAKEIVEYGKKINLDTHYCSAGFKDKVQLGNRFMLRAASVAKPYDQIDEEGLLTRGEITADNINTLKEIKKDLIEYFEIPEKFLAIEKNRLLISADILSDFWQDKEFLEEFDWCDTAKAAIVKEYPTSDHFVVEKEILP